MFHWFRSIAPTLAQWWSSEPPFAIAACNEIAESWQWRSYGRLPSEWNFLNKMSCISRPLPLTSGVLCEFRMRFPLSSDSLHRVPRPKPDETATPGLKYLAFDQTPITSPEGHPRDQNEKVTVNVREKLTPKWSTLITNGRRYSSQGHWKISFWKSTNWEIRKWRKTRS